eukprot:TRINITY_DN21604_c0_g1_i1.p1 TRINITY_DN21604_c0_g1~~TRINITY_DN21604_c0_g1_i1.p1  ORF type:complete len:835 (+),score=155.99 TRINITY_DN21604_c0_g1_i1:147-2651(+)
MLRSAFPRTGVASTSQLALLGGGGSWSAVPSSCRAPQLAPRRWSLASSRSRGRGGASRSARLFGAGLVAAGFVALRSCRIGRGSVLTAHQSRRMVACKAGGDAAAAPPVAEKQPHTVLVGRVENETRGKSPMDPPKQVEDPYFWLRDDTRSKPEVLDHLKAENAYTDARTSHLTAFRDELYAELRSHQQEADEEYPMPRGAFEYYKRHAEGLSYAIHCRRPAGGGAEQTLLDENQLAEGREYCVVSDVEASPQQKLVAFTADFTGYETYDLYVREIGSDAGVVLAPEVKDIAGFAWGAGDDTDIYYLTLDEAHRPNAVWRHVIGTPQSADVRLFLEDDDLFNVDVRRSRDGSTVLVESESTETSEVHYIDLEGGDGTSLRCIRGRQPGVRYLVEPAKGKFYVVTNEGRQLNSVLRTCAIGEDVAWEPILLPSADGGASEALPHSETRSLSYVYAFADFVAITGREDGLSQIWVIRGSELHRVEWPDAAYACGVDGRSEYTSAKMRVRYSTLVQPPTDMLYDVAGRALETLRVKPVPNYDPSLYATARLHARAADGTEIPISLLWRRDSYKQPGSDGAADDASPRRLHLVSYGSYGISEEPSFSMTRLPLVDRGMVYALAHIRGGGEMGRWKWYEEGGKYLSKKNTFTDFIACAEHLLKGGWVTSAEHMSIEGRSAGGLLMGAVLNMRPDLFRAAVAGVPFVDVLVTMCDPSIPLTCGEWEEWGNPNEERYFEYMKSYSPIDNVREEVYPSILITAGLHDPRVAYWEPAKYAQVLRERRTNPTDDGREVLLKMDLGAGHFSASDRYKYLKELSFDQSWLLAQLGLADTRPPQSAL